MSYYYFDVETFSPNAVPSPGEDKLITLQFQELDPATGQPEGELTILKEWESSEKEVLQRFAPLVKPWSFIPVGTNLRFDRSVLAGRCAAHGIALHGDVIEQKLPSIDLKSIFVILNRGQFKGSGMHNFTAKKTSGAMIGNWYAEKNYVKIEEYIREEAAAFIEFYQKCCKELPRVLLREKIEV